MVDCKRTKAITPRSTLRSFVPVAHISTLAELRDLARCSLRFILENFIGRSCPPRGIIAALRILEV